MLLLGHFVRRFVGLSATESATLFNLFQARVTKLENTVRWTWEPGDVAFWDNRATQHYAVADYDDQYRRLSAASRLSGDIPGGRLRPAKPGGHVATPRDYSDGRGPGAAGKLICSPAISSRRRTVNG